MNIPITVRPNSRKRRMKTGMLPLLFIAALQPWVTACASERDTAAPFSVSSSAGAELIVTPLAEFDRPWAMTFLPDGLLLVTEKGGRLWLLTLDVAVADATTSLSLGSKREVVGLPDITAGGQGGFGDVVLHPDFANNQQLYISFVEREQGRSGAVVARATFDANDATPAITDLQVIWRQTPKVSGEGHYGHRIAFSGDGHLFITSGERQKFTPAQDMTQNLGKVIRLKDDGGVPGDNPFAAMGGIASQVWSLGHRNPLGIAFDQAGQLWVHEMGPRGGDELNLVVAGANYGYPIVSNGRHYSGIDIPDHDTKPEFNAPAISWSPVISPSGLIVYSGQRYNGWQGNGLIGGLSSQSLVRVELGNPASEIERFAMGKRIREVEQGPDGYVYVLEDKSGGRLLRIEPQ